jgi:rubrerythrin
MLSLIKLEDNGSTDACSETYYKNKPELEKQIEEFQKLYHILLDQYTPVLARFSVSSISTANQLENTSALNPQPLNMNSSNSITEPCLQHVDPEAQLQNTEKLTEISHKNLQENSSLSDRHYESFSFPSTREAVRNYSTNSDIELSVEDIDPEVLEKNISKLSDTSHKNCDQGVFERWIEFEKRISTSEVILELAEDNKTHMDELLRRYEDQNRVNNMLKEQIEVLMKENQLLHDENLKLMSENKLLVNTIGDQVKEQRSCKLCSSCYGLNVIKNGLSWLKARIISPCM